MSDAPGTPASIDGPASAAAAPVVAAPDNDPVRSITLDSPLTHALGGRTAKMLDRAFGMTTVGQLLGHYPRRYSHRGELTALDSLPDGEHVSILAEVRRVASKDMKARRGSIQEVVISDGRGYLHATFFNQPWRLDTLRVGRRGMFSGKVSRYRGEPQLTHPDYELFDEDDAAASPGSPEAKRWAEKPLPIYSATASVPTWVVARSVAHTLDMLDRDRTPDPLPDTVRHEHELLGFLEALDRIHRPEADADYRAAQKTLRFHEAFVLQAALLERHLAEQGEAALPRTASPGGFLSRLDAGLTFALTADQQRVGAEIAADLARSSPMNRLLQGEVGSGKTLVAVRAMATVAESGGQSVLLAPTEVLAGQHLRSIQATLGPALSEELGLTLLTGQMGAAERRKALLRIVSGQARIVVGTHALLGDAVEFYDLGLVIVDEQHRFGVEQRDTLRAKGRTRPHLLVMTATPIPRTIAMTVFGDLDISTITELPRGRQRIDSFVVALREHPGWIGRAWARAAEEISGGRQVFVVCPAISPVDADSDGFEEATADHPAGQEESNTGDADTGKGTKMARSRQTGSEGVRAASASSPGPVRGASAPSPVAAGGGPAAPQRPARASVEEIRAVIAAEPSLAQARVAVLHGRLSSEEKDSTMRAFVAGDIDLLVATTVIEVGVDVPNASTMIVLDADAFGVSQLHQLRGRVGRGSHPGLCLLVTRAAPASLGMERVEAVASTLDGFELAQLDLKLRREGDVLGARQSGGASSLRLLRVADDAEVIEDARAAASTVLAADPTLGDHPALRAALARRLDESARDFLARG